MKIILKIALSTILIGLHYSNYADYKSIKKDLKVGLKGTNVDGGQSKAKVLQTFIDLKFQEKIFPTLEGKVSVKANFETGSNKSTVVDYYSPKNSLKLAESYLSWDPYNFFSLKFGSLSQFQKSRARKKHRSFLFIRTQPLTAAKEELYYIFNNNYKIFVNFQQAIPNNDALTDRLVGIDEGTPSFFTQSVGLDFTGDIISLYANLSHFQFNNLSSYVANQSRYIGNSIVGSGDTNSSFLYGFDGFHFLTHLTLQFTPDFKVEPFGRYLFNDKAPDNRNTGSAYGAHFKYRGHGPGFFLYENQSDSSPAFYANNFYAKNTEGYSVYFSGELESKNLEYKISYVASNLINTSLYQTDQKFISFKITKKYRF